VRQFGGCYPHGDNSDFLRKRGVAMLRIRDVLKTKGSDIWSVSSKVTVYKALEVMAEKNVGALLVVEDEKLVGIFSERDYARKVVLKGKHAQDILLEELMTKEVYSVTPSETVEECMAVMTAAHCRHMPVYEDKKLVGVVSIGDIVNATIIEHKVKIRDLEKYIAGF
jgi:CBS domain-containing protein